MATPIIVTPPPPPPPPDRPMSRAEFNALCRDTFAILGESFDSPQARAMLWAIGRQEGRLIDRRQVGGGPARGLWQFERGGGVKGVLNHEATAELAEALCKARKVKPATADVHKALEIDDVLACGFARLLLWSDPRALPKRVASAENESWAYYFRNWRPGKPHRATWGKFWREAVA